MNEQAIDRDHISVTVQRVLAAQPVTDLHTHLYSPGFGTPVVNATGRADPAGLMLWGIDELVTYHYLVAEVFRVVPAGKLPYEQFWKMSKTAQADHTWKHLFVERTPISEACRGVLTTLRRLGLDPNEKTLEPYRRYFAAQEPGGFIDRVMQVANVRSITMTNPVFDDNERERWLRDPAALADPRFRAVLRIDPILRDYPTAAKKMSEWGFRVSSEIDEKTIEEARRFLREWIDRQKAIYLAVSLPPEFRYPAEADDADARAGQVMLEKVVLPVCAERGLPFAMMIGSRLRVNPALRDAGDMVGKADVASVANLCREFPGNKFLVTMLSREDQH
ncbi:MAG: Glucuronate isomerase [Phycisphaerales bacterium]|nr:Glucuronate isomerase [Phycisphaerales bacterium]